MVITIAIVSIIIVRSGMKTERIYPLFMGIGDHHYWGADSLFTGEQRCQKNEISFSCSSEFSSSLDIHKSKNGS